MVEKIKGFFADVFSSSKKTIIFLIIVAVVIAVIATLVTSNKEKDARQEAIDRGNKLQEEREQASTEETENSDDVYLLKIQKDLIDSYGPLPDGYIWETDGTLLSLGDPDMSAEDVVYAYLNGVRSLDLSMAQKYSRHSKVVATYEDYFDSKAISDYTDSFKRNMYKEVMLSIQPLEIVDTSVFAENKQVFTVKINILDLSSKDFWIPDKEEIYKNLYIYSKDEEDVTKSDNYLYDYVLSYYRSGTAATKDVTINLTVERFPDLNTGWLVSMDSDLNDLCNYKDGNIVASFIKSSFQDEGIDMVRDQMTTETTEETTEANKKKKKKKEEEATTEVEEEVEDEVDGAAATEDATPEE